MSVFTKWWNTRKNKQPKNKTMRLMNCSPSMKNKRATNDTCFTPNILIKIKSDYNHSNRTNPIRETEPKKILKELRKRLTQCENEDCWLRQMKDAQLRKKIQEYVFAPKRPKEWVYNPNEWLSNYDIFNVLTQYEDIYPHFEFIGPSFIDFDKPLQEGTCVTNELCHFSLKHHILKKHFKIAVVFNLDKHTGPGTHWVSLFVDVKERFIFYFDSAGSKIPSEIMTLVKRIQTQGLELSKKIHFKFHENYPMTHQYTNTECGMYSLFFIITMLLNKPDESIHDLDHTKGGFDKIRFFKKQRIPDKFVSNLRTKYFNQ